MIHLQLPTSHDAVIHIQKLLDRNQVAHALELADKSVRTWPDDKDLLIFVADLANKAGRSVAALELLNRAARLGEPRAEVLRQSIIDNVAPHWHFRMMNDEVRNKAYDSALQHYVNEGSIVLDIGCGGGLLSMMAARAGARHVYACEVQELVHHQAQKVIAQNGYSDKITAINKVSNALKIGVDLPEKADIIVAEVFDTGLLGEEALRTFEHAREHLLKPTGVILPARASVQAVLIESALLQNEAVTTRCCGFDAIQMNELSPSYIQTRLDAFPHKRISDVKTIFNFDFSQSVEDQLKQVEFEITETGLCHGVCFWFTLDFGHQIKMSTGPENRWNCWMQAFSAFASPVSVARGKSLTVSGRHTQNRVCFEHSSILKSDQQL